MFDALKIRILEAHAFAYEGEDGRGLAAAADAFYRAHPGFCPVPDGFFYLEERKLYLTLAAKGEAVAIFGYDLSRQPSLVVAHLEGVAERALPVAPCQTAR
ncbi:MAG: hypothetical protein HC933_17795 [Pleurocapsa sp. SU_196_0]|nr:hypothetical protein [Pleurocapsa sp. SU_196_0]